MTNIISLFILTLVVVLYNGGIVDAHMSIFVPSMWGSEPDNINSNWAVQPLQNLNFKDWWMHGTKSLNDPPPANAVTQLPAGGTLDFEITGNKAFTSMGRGLWTVAPGVSPRLPPDPWSNDMHGGSSNIHAPAHVDVGGCAFGIAYKSKINDVVPEDFVIFSVVHDCIARQLQAFDVPALPACPNGMCICSWFWIHKSIGGTDQMYMTAFQCNVSNPSNRAIGKPVVPVRCDGKPPYSGGPVTTTCKKPLMAMYWANNEGNNMLNPVNTQSAPTYSDEYGFPDGAQHQIFMDSDSYSCDKNSIGDTIISNKNTTGLTTSPNSVLTSPSCLTRLTVQEDGNVVLYEIQSGKPIWSTKTSGVNGVAPYHLQMQEDGNLVLEDSRHTIFWSTNILGGHAPYSLKLRDVMRLSVVDSNGETMWEAKI